MAEAMTSSRSVRLGAGLRPLLVGVHRYLGLIAMVFLVLAAGTGTLLVYAETLDAALNPDLFRAPSTARDLPPLELAARLEAGDRRLLVVAVPLAERRGRAVAMSVAPRPDVSAGAAANGAQLGFDQMFVDPGSGAVLGVRQDRPGWDRRHLMRGVYLFHYTLLAGDWGRWLMGGVAFCWVLENLAGAYLTLPTGGPFWKRWAPVWQVNFKASLPRLLLDLHRATGLWLFIGVTVMAATSVALNFYSELAAPAARALSPPASAPWDRPAPTTPWRPPRLTFEAAERLALRDAARDRLHLHPAVATYDPRWRIVGIGFTGNGLVQYAGLGPVTYYYDDQDGRLVFVDNPMTDSAGQKALRALFPLHSGQVGGVATQFLVALLGLSVIEMAVTGLIVWWKKRGPRVAARRLAGGVRRGPGRPRPTGGGSA